MKTNMIKNLGIGLVTVFLMMLSVAGYSQACPGNQATVTLKNITNPTSTTLEFGVYIKNTGTTAMLFAGMAGDVVYNSNLLPSGATGTFSCITQPSATGNFPNLNVTAPAHTVATRQLRWTNTPVSLGSGNTVNLPLNSDLFFARFRFTSTLPWTTSFAGTLTMQYSVVGGYTNFAPVVYCSSNPSSTTLTSATAGTLVTHDASNTPYAITLNAPTNICATSGAASASSSVTCFGGNDGTATITMTPTSFNRRNSSSGSV